MEVLLLTQVLPYPPDSGAKVKTWNLLKCVATQHHVTLVSFSRGEPAEAMRQLENHCRAVYTVPMRRGAMGDVWHLARSVARREPFVLVRDDRGAMRRLVDEVAGRRRFAVVHADQLNMAPYALRVAGARRILDAHNALWDLYRQLASVESRPLWRALCAREARRLRVWEGRLCQAFDAVLAVSAADRDALVGAGAPPTAIRVLPIVVDTDRVRPVQRRPGATRLLHLGPLHWPPNADGLQWFVREVVPRIRHRHPDVAIDVVGARPPRWLDRAARTQPGLRIHGYVDDPIPYCESAAVLVVPLRAGSGMRVRILEGLARGMPIVTTPIGCAGIAVTNEEHVLVAESAAAFADACVRLMSEPALGAALGRRGRALIEQRYGAHDQCARLLDVYAQLRLHRGAHSG